MNIKTVGQKAAHAYFNSTPNGVPAPIARDTLADLARVIDRTVKQSGIIAACDDLYDAARAAGVDTNTLTRARAAMAAITGQI